MRVPFEVDLNKKKTNRSDSTVSPNEAPKPFSVTQLTRQISLLLEGKFRNIRVLGELSNLKQAASGHWYFSLKDDRTQIRGVMFRQAAAQLGFEPEEGLEVVVYGSVGVYQQRGEYQINVTSMEPKGMGALQLAFEQLKNKLNTEGLFLDDHKKALPFIPRKIGLVTSSTGAVIHDMLTVLERRFPGIPVLLFPTQVQGDTAAASLVEGVQHLNKIAKKQKIDVLIIGRGGGSIEDLWAFNDETLARAIFASKIPVISAVGHETDFSICDFVSDQRAPTPSAAMEMAVPEKEILLNSVRILKERKTRALNNYLQQSSEMVDYLRERLISPTVLIEQYTQKITDLESLLKERNKYYLEHLKQNLAGTSEKLNLLNPNRELLQQHHAVDQLQDRLNRAMQLMQKNMGDSVQKQMDLLDSLSPLKELHRGYSVTMNDKGKSIRSVNETEPGDLLQLRMEDGTIHTKVMKLKPQITNE